MKTKIFALAALCSLAACSTTDTSSDTGDQSAATPAGQSESAAAPGTGQAPEVPFEIGEFPDSVETTEFTLSSGGVKRTGIVVAPADGDITGLPVVISLHGSGSEPYEHVVWTNTAGDPAERGYIAIIPQGSISDGEGGFSWNVPGVTDAPETPSDVEFLEDLAAWARSEYATETVFATGYSGGGRMISQVACASPHTFDAIAPITGLRAGEPVEADHGFEIKAGSCDPGQGTPIVTLSGSADPVNPYDGGGADYWGYGHEAALDRWTQINECGEPEVSEDSGVVTSTYECAGGPIVDVLIAGAGHVWAGSPAFERETDWAGTPSYAVDTNDLIWEFFDSIDG